MAERTTLSGQEVQAHGLDDWRYLLRALHGRFTTGDFATGLRLVQQIGAVAEEADHHPDLDLRYTHLNVKLSSHDAGGVTERDIRLARRISDLAASEGASADPMAVSVLEVALDTAESQVIKPFWAAVLGLEQSKVHDEDLIDRNGNLATLWFQDTEPHPEPKQRFHLDLHVPHDLVEDRLDAALEAGGTLVTDEHAPSFWVLADPEGNKVCLCTWLERDHVGRRIGPSDGS